MTHRNRTILRLLSDTRPRYTTIERIAEETGAGVRTIHRDLEGLERSLRLRGVRLERRRGTGIRLIDPLPEGLSKNIVDRRPEEQVDSGQRPMMVLLYLIAAADWVKISEIAGALYVTDSTIGADLNTLETWLPPDMTIERHKGTGIRLNSEELPARLLFLSSFPSLVPMYIIDDEKEDMQSRSGEDRFIATLGVREDRNRIVGMIDDAEKILGYGFSPTYRGYLYSYLFLLFRRAERRSLLEAPPGFRLDLPAIYRQAAASMVSKDLAALTDFHRVMTAETDLLARIIASCETASPPIKSVGGYLGSIASSIEAMLEHSLSRLEEKERIWLHDDRLLLNYFRMTIAAAARRIDLGVSNWWEVGVRPYPGIEDTPESVVLVSQFLSDLGRLLKEPKPVIVRREIQEISYAIGARLESLRTRSVCDLRIKILCYEGLGMANYILALAREAFPDGTIFDSQWEPDFERTVRRGAYDLVISTFPLRLRETRHLMVRGDDSPDEIRRRFREALGTLEGAVSKPLSRTPETGGTNEDALPDRGKRISLSTVMSVIEGFFVEARNSGTDAVTQAIAALDRGDCDTGMMKQDFERRESFGTLVFEEWNLRLLHCRTEGIPDPRAGVLQGVEGEETILVLAAPVTALQSQTHALSEIVIALNEYPDFSRILARGDKRSIQARLMTLFGRKAG